MAEALSGFIKRVGERELDGHTPGQHSTQIALCERLEQPIAGGSALDWWHPYSARDSARSTSAPGELKKQPMADDVKRVSPLDWGETTATILLRLRASAHRRSALRSKSKGKRSTSYLAT